jgi:Uma2 family endonuclease
MTVDDLVDWPDDDGYRYELVDGILVRVAGSGDLATTVGATIVGLLKSYVRPRRLGRVTGADGVYKFPGAETGLLPDAGFYVAARRALVIDRTRPIPFAPDLAVEVASPTQREGDLAAKAALYFRGGTRLVWVVWPGEERIDVWHPGDRAPTVLYRGDALDGEDVIPGLRHPVSDVFTDDMDES